MPRSTRSGDEQINWVSSAPFLAFHLVPLAMLWTGVPRRAVLLCVALYFGRMFFITAGYHRYFAHRSYRLGRPAQFLMALGGTTALQKGPLWWAAHHRHHHRYSDMPEDIHSPLQKGFWFSHVGWILCNRYDETQLEQIKDFARFPELRWLNSFHLVPPILLATSLFFLGGFRMLV